MFPADPMTRPAPAERRLPAPEPALPEIPRAELIEWAREEISVAAQDFLGELHDVDVHHYTGVPLSYLPSARVEDLAATTLALLERVDQASAHARAAVTAAMARRAYLISGAPLVCGNCNQSIVPDLDTWQVCTGWAEHTSCHRDAPGAEAQARAWSVAEDESSAHLHHRTVATVLGDDEAGVGL